MEPLLLSQIAGAVEGRLTGADLKVTGVSIDTRSLQADQLFVAIKGPRFDGHDFLKQARQQGSAAAMISGLSPLPGSSTRCTWKGAMVMGQIKPWSSWCASATQASKRPVPMP